MRRISTTFLKLSGWHLPFIVLLCFTPLLQGQGVERSHLLPPTVHLVEPTYNGIQRYYVDSTIYQPQFSRFSRTYTLDSTRQYISITEKLFDFDYRLPVTVEVDYYVTQRVRNDGRNQWRETVLRNLSKESQAGGSGIELNIPVKIKSKAFKRIFGGDRVGLRVTGSITFELAGRAEQRSGSAVSAFEERGNFSPKFKQTQQFRVEGKVGDKVSVSVDQNSEATFDFENTLKLIYTGDEDEIVQKIEAGNVALNLPSTNYVSTSANHQGLFGLKTQMQVGNLSFIGIASLERGENQKITTTGSASENTNRIRDIDYSNNRFFFIDSTYLENFENFNEQMRWIKTPATPRITQLDVWKTTESTNEQGRSAWAVLDPQNYTIDGSLPEFKVDGKIESGKFEKLEFGKHYDYDENRGFISFRQTIEEKDVIAVAYATEFGDTLGEIFTGDTTQTDTLLLKLVKPRYGKPGFESTWKLVMRNVYNLGASGIPIEGFDVRVLFTVTGEDQEVEVQSGSTYNFLMGLDRLNEQGSPVEGGDKTLDRNGFILDLANGYLIFPSLTPFAPNDSTYFIRPEGSDFDITRENYVSIYNLKDRTASQQQSKFNIEITSRSVSTTYNLGFNVLEGSEIVRLNGRQLTRDKDYTIDYFSGTLQVIATEARRADAQVDIEYERASLFQLDKKTLVGGRMEYALGQDNFIGMTALYYNQSTLDQRVRVGQEPIKNLVWDVNTALTFKPNIITKAFDILPIVTSSAESRLRIEAEYAQVNPNPNTFEEPGLGEKGLAYIDDFEGSKRATTLGIQYRIWTPSSIPEKFRILRRDSVNYTILPNNEELMLRMDQNRIKMNWYNPFNQVPIKDIWPNRDVNTQTGTTTNVLNLRWRNDSIHPDSAWAGVMRSTITFADQKKTKFLELWIKPRLAGETENSNAQLNINIGKISEDYWIRGENFANQKSLGNLNTEDFNNNGLLDEGEDVGIDGIPDGQPGDDPDDDWAAPEATTPSFLKINGTEGSGEQKTARYPDTEDLDGDGDVNIFNDYFEYSFALDDLDNPYIVGATQNENGVPTGWIQYRIPIKVYDEEAVVGDPDTTFQEVFAVRFWVNDIQQEDRYRGIQIATIDFVGSDWEERGVKEKNQTDYVLSDELFSVSVVNDEENAVEGEDLEAYHSPPGVSGIEDRITKVISKEQSLLLNLVNIRGDSTIAEVEKRLNSKMNLVHYRTLKMFVHGDRNLPAENSQLEFYIRFGSTQDIFYEYREKLYPHWDPRNEVILDFNELTQTRQDQYLVDSSQALYVRPDPNYPEKYFVVKGKPGLHNINYFVMGIRNVGSGAIVNQQVWVDELRVTDIEKESGSAMRLYTDLTVADIGRISANFELVDDNFRKIEQQFPSTDGRDKTREVQSYTASLKLDKFLPERLGFDIPVNARYSRSRSIPKYFYNSDRKTGYGFASFSERIQALFGLSKLPEGLEETIDVSESRSIGGTLRRKKRQRDLFLFKYTINLMEFDADYSEKSSSSPTILFNDTKSLSGRFSYNLPFGRNNFIRPFAVLGKSRLLKPLTSQKLYFTPSNVNVNFSLTDNETERQNRLENNPTQTITVGTTRQFGVNYKLTDNIDIGLNRNTKSDAYSKGYRASDVMQKIFSEFDFGDDVNINQRFTVDYTPKFSNWLTPSFRYSSDFGYIMTNPGTTRDQTGTLKIGRSMRVDLKPTILMQKIYKPKPKPKPRNTQPQIPGMKGLQSGQQDAKKDSSEEGKNGIQTEEEGKGGSEGEVKKPSKPVVMIPNPAILMWRFLNAWKSINVDITANDDFTNPNLSEVPVWKYQFGFSSDPGVDTSLAGNKVPIIPGVRKTRGISAGVQLDIFKNLSTNLKYRRDKIDNLTNQRRNLTLTNNYFFTRGDPEENQKSWSNLVPDWSLRLSGVEKMLFFSNFVQTMSLEHARTGKFSESSRIEGEVEIRENWSYSNSYQPFLGINFTTRFGVNGSIRYLSSVNFNYNPSGAVTKAEQSGFNITASYSMSKGFKLPIPFIKNRTLKNEIQLSLAYDKNNNRTYAKTSLDPDFVEREVNNSWKIRPSATYRFSQKVNGTAFFEKGATENKRTGVYSYLEFGVNMNIAIR